MEQLCNGHEVQPDDLGVVKFSVASPLTAANKRKHWTGKCRRIDSRSALWVCTIPTYMTLFFIGAVKK